MASLLARPAHERSTGKGKEGAGDSGPSHGLGRRERERACVGIAEEKLGRERENRPARPETEKERVFFFPFSIFFSFLFQIQFKYEPMQTQILFPIYFAIQNRRRTIVRFSKNKFYSFLNSFIFKFSFLLFQNHF